MQLAFHRGALAARGTAANKNIIGNINVKANIAVINTLLCGGRNATPRDRARHMLSAVNIVLLRLSGNRPTLKLPSPSPRAVVISACIVTTGKEP